MRRLLSLTLGLFLLAPAVRAGTGAFTLVVDESVRAEPFTGTIFVAFGEVDGREPRRAMHSWFGAPPLLRFEVKSLAPGDSVTVNKDGASRFHPLDWSSVEPQAWTVQAVARASRTGRRAGFGDGDLYSAAVEIEYDPESDGAVTLNLSSVHERAPMRETERVKLFELRSDALSEFHGFDYVLRAGVLLPEEHDPAKSYPVVVSVTGFGGSHESIRGWARRTAEPGPLDQAIVVVPDASNRYGHSVFCNSASIGPWGEALVDELLPALDAKFGGAGAQHRYVTGVSSGGWSSLWLQVAYPDAFAGCWSHVPDPIDFHDFQQIDLYEPLPDGTPRNMYVDEAGNERPVARRGDEVRLTYREFVQREHVLNPGGQIRSFEATFSPPGPDGMPRRVFDVETGSIDHEAARAWREYDLSHRLLTGWDELRGKLAGKVHVYAGEVDSFYLEGAVERFQALAREAGMLDDMTVEVVPGMAHALHRPGYEAMVETIARRWSEAHGAPEHAEEP